MKGWTCTKSTFRLVITLLVNNVRCCIETRFFYNVNSNLVSFGCRGHSLVLETREVPFGTMSTPSVVCCSLLVVRERVDGKVRSMKLIQPNFHSTTKQTSCPAR